MTITTRLHSPHDHVFLGNNHARNERRTWLVIVITATMMVIEIAAGSAYGSMALVADGWHMSTHAAAMLIAALAYMFARGVIRYLKWRRLNPGTVTNCDSVIVESPDSLFKVRFDADCVVKLDEKRVAIHVWNTKGTKLSRHLVLAALTLVQRNWPRDVDAADDFAVLSLQDMKLYRWSDDPKTYQGLADNLMAHLDRLCRASIEEHGGTRPTVPADQPSPEI